MRKDNLINEEEQVTFKFIIFSTPTLCPTNPSFFHPHNILLNCTILMFKLIVLPNIYFLASNTPLEIDCSPFFCDKYSIFQAQ